MKKTLLLATTAFALSAPAFAGDTKSDLDVVKSFYSEVLTTPADLTEDQFNSIMAENLVSIPTPPLGAGAKGVFDTVKYFGEVVPDLEWTPQEILQNGNRYTVRSIATGTPVGAFFGVDPATGKSFEIMSIDIVTVDGGKISQIYHLEDWTGAIAQLTAQ